MGGESVLGDIVVPHSGAKVVNIAVGNELAIVTKGGGTRSVTREGNLYGHLPITKIGCFIVYVLKIILEYTWLT